MNISRTDRNKLVEDTWNNIYPGRKPWKDISQEARDEWLRVFDEYEQLRRKLVYGF